MKTKDEIMTLAWRCEQRYTEYFNDDAIGKNETLYDLLEAERNGLEAALDEVFAENARLILRLKLTSDTMNKYMLERDALKAITDEYNAWIRHHAAGHDYDDFLKKTLETLKGAP